MKRYVLPLLAMIYLVGGGCEVKKPPQPIGPTTLDLTVNYEDTNLPVDSAQVTIAGRKGSYISGNYTDSTFFRGKCNYKGRLNLTLKIPSGFSVGMSIGKFDYTKNKSYQTSNCPAQCQLTLGRTNELIVYLKVRQ